MAIKYDKDDGWSNWFTKVQVSGATKNLLSNYAGGLNGLYEEKGEEFFTSHLKDKFKIVDETEIENLKKWRKELSKTDNPLKTYKKNVLAADKTTSSFGKKAGGVFKSIGATLGSMAINMGIGMIADGIIQGISYFASADERAREAAEKAAEESKQRADEAKQELETLDDLIAKYKELAENGVSSNETEEVKGIQNDIVDLVGEQAKGIDLVNEGYEKQIKLLNDIRDGQADVTQDTARVGYLDSKKAYSKRDKRGGTAGWASDIGVDLFGDGAGGYTYYWDNVPKKTKEVLAGAGIPIFKLENKLGMTMGAGLNIDTGTVMGDLAIVNDAIDALEAQAEDTGNDEWISSDFYRTLVKWRDEMQKEYDTQRGFADTVLSGEFDTVFDKYKNDSPANAEEYAEQRYAIIEELMNSLDLKDMIKDGVLTEDDIAKYVDSIMPSLLPDASKEYQASNTVMNMINKHINDMLGREGSWDIETVTKAVVEQLKAEGYSGKDLSYASDVLTEWVIGNIDDWQKELSEEEIDAIEQLAFDYIPEKMNEIASHFEDNPIDLEVSKSTSEALSSLSTAFNQLSNDGYITFEAMNKIKEVTGLTGDAWAEYETKLLNAKIGSQEFNQTMSDLTYTILESEIGLDNLADTDEKYIARLLEENGCLNSVAVAHDIVERARAAELIQARLALGVTDKQIEALLSEAGTCDITSDAFIYLVAQEILFNKNELDTTGKIQALQDLAKQAGLTGTAIAAVLATPYGKSSEEQMAWAKDHGFTIEKKLNADGTVKTTKDGKEDWIWKDKEGNTYENANEAALSIASETFSKVLTGEEGVTARYDDTTKSSPKDTKDKAFNAFKADIEAREKIIEKYKDSIDIIKFGLDISEDDDFITRTELLTNKIEQLTSYGQLMREEFDRISNIIPNTADEAETLTSRLESLGSEIRSNITEIREAQVAIEQLKIDSIVKIGADKFKALERALDGIETRIGLLSKDNSEDYKYLRQSLVLDALLPTSSNRNRAVTAKRRENRALIKEQESYHNEVVSMLESEISKNEELRESERQAILTHLGLIKEETQIKLSEVQDDYTQFLTSSETDTESSSQNIAEIIDSTDVEFPNPTIDMSDVDDAVLNTIDNFSDFGVVIDDLNKKAKLLTDYLAKISEITDGATDGDDPALAPPKKTSTGRGGGEIDTDDALQAYKERIEGFIDKHSFEFLDGDVSELGYGDPLHPGYSKTSSFGWRTHPVTGERKYHSGMDIGAGYGTKIYSVSDGVVTLSGENGGYGNCIIIRDNNGYSWLYGHMAEVSNLKVGDKVGRGQHIGLVGSSGISTGAHLHIELRKNGGASDPSLYLPNYAHGTSLGNAHARHLGIAGENYKPEVLIDKKTGEFELIDTPTIIDTTKTDVIGERATAKLPKFAEGTIATEDHTAERIQGYIDSVTKQIGDITKEAYYKVLAIETKALGQEGQTAADEQAKELFKAYKESFDSASPLLVNAKQTLINQYLDYINSTPPDEISEKVIQAYEDAVNDVSSQIEGLANDMSSARDTYQSHLDDSIAKMQDVIDERDFYDSWDESGTNKVEYLAEYLEYFKRTFPKELDRIKELEKLLYTARQDQINDNISELERYNSLVIDGIQEQIDNLDDRIQKEETLLQIKQKEYDATNKLRNEQREVNKAIADSLISAKYLTDRERAEIFNLDDYEKLSDKIASTQAEINALSDEYYTKIQGLGEDELYLKEAMTAEYERQLAAKERELELTKAEVDLKKKQQILDNVLAERNVRFLNAEGKWEWIADQDKVRQATADVMDSKGHMEDIKEQQKQQRDLDNRQANIDSLNAQKAQFNQQIEAINEETEKFKKVIENVQNPIRDLETIFKEFKNTGVKSFVEGFNDVLTTISEVTGRTYDFLNSKVFDPVEASGGGVADASVVANLDGRRWGGGSGSSLAAYIKRTKANRLGYASGTKSATGGLRQVDEEGEEVFITSDGVFKKFTGGEMVFNKLQTERLYDFVNMPKPLPYLDIPTLNATQSVDKSQNFYGGITVVEPTDFNDFVRQLTNKIRNKQV